MSKTTYITTGKCIWCGGNIPQVSFSHEPHIIPHALGADELGTDICDECNSFFGTSKRGIPAVDVVFKEVMNTAYSFGKTLNEDTYKTYRSAYFTYLHTQGLIKVKQNIPIWTLTRQFKKGLYGVFLQKYHKETKLGNDPKYDSIRQYVRFDKGDFYVYYLYNHFNLRPTDEFRFELPMSDKQIEDMGRYGMFHFSLFGHNFFMEVLKDISWISKEYYLQEQANNFAFLIKGDERIKRLDKITDMDFFMRRFHPQLRIKINNNLMI